MSVVMSHLPKRTQWGLFAAVVVFVATVAIAMVALIFSAGNI